MIQTRMRKSGVKRVYKQENEGIRGELNAAAREVFRGKPREITRGVAGLSDPVVREQSDKSEKILHLRRRRGLASLKREKAARATKVSRHAGRTAKAPGGKRK